MDFIPWGSVQCVATLDFYDRLVLIFVVPIGVLILVAVVPFVALMIQNRLDYSDSNEEREHRKQSRHKIIRLIVFALFLSTASPAAQRDRNNSSSLTSVVLYVLCGMVYSVSGCIEFGVIIFYMSQCGRYILSGR